MIENRMIQKEKCAFFRIFQAICWASDAPSTFIRYFQYLDTLNSKDAPDYEYLKDVLGRTLSQKEVDDMDLDFQGWENERILE